MKTDISHMDVMGAQYLFCSSDAAGIVPRFVIELTEPIKEDLLKQAFNKALKRFPHMAMGVQPTETGFCYVELKKEAPVFHEEGQVLTMASQDTNGYQVKVSYDGNHIYVDFLHSLGDGLGMNIFLQSMLFCYLKLAGYPVENDGTIADTEQESKEEEREDVMEWLRDVDCSDMKAMENLKEYPAFQMPNEGKNDGTETIVEIHLPFSQLGGAAKHFETTPLTFVSPIFSAAIYEHYEELMEVDHPIVTAVPINMRGFFKTASTRYFISVGAVAFGKRFTEVEFPEILKANKTILDAQLDKHYLSKMAVNGLDGTKKMLEAPVSRKEKCAMVAAGATQALCKQTYIITNVGNIKMPESMGQFVVDFHPVLPAAQMPFAIAITSFKGEMVISIAQRDKDTRISERFVQMLNELQIGAEIRKIYQFSPMRYDGAEV